MVMKADGEKHYHRIRKPFVSRVPIPMVFTARSFLREKGCRENHRVGEACQAEAGKQHKSPHRNDDPPVAHRMKRERESHGNFSGIIR